MTFQKTWKIKKSCSKPPTSNWSSQLWNTTRLATPAGLLPHLLHHFFRIPPWAPQEVRQILNEISDAPKWQNAVDVFLVLKITGWSALGRELEHILDSSTKHRVEMVWNALTSLTSNNLGGWLIQIVHLPIPGRIQNPAQHPNRLHPMCRLGSWDRIHLGEAF